MPVLGGEVVGNAGFPQPEQGAAGAQALGDGVVEDGSEAARDTRLRRQRTAQVESEPLPVGAQIVQAGGGQMLG